MNGKHRMNDDFYKQLIEASPIGYAYHKIICDKDGIPCDYEFIEVNNSFENLTGLKGLDIVGRKISKVLPDIKNGEFDWISIYGDIAINGGEKEVEQFSASLQRWYKIKIYSPEKYYFVTYFIDITKQMNQLSEMERLIEISEEIQYLGYHDQLTGLYNRRFYEEELKRLDSLRNLPMTIVMGDVNGLKLINDCFGHVMGDELLKKVAQVIKLGCRNDEVIARLGGDEFVIILPKTDSIEAEQIIKRIINLSLSEKVYFIDISISFGYKTKNNEKEKIEDIFKNAEDNMYKKKLIESQSMRIKTIKAIMNTIYEKDKNEEKHSQRVSELCKLIGEAIGLSEHIIEELISVGLLHDIGTIAIDEHALNKIDELNGDEWEEIKRHPEIGYRIINTVNDMSDVARYVLYHHERWDGKGYPKGLKGYEIPIESRITAIADAYDRMTSGRGYKKALSKEEAIEELQKNSGIQFDPEMVKVFTEKVI